ncbi:hypothetical protein [Spirochaeta dissipatitropha]
MSDSAETGRQQEYAGFRSQRLRPQEGSLWYPLDNAAKIFPPVQGVRSSTLFRLAAVVDHPVKLPALETALERVMQRFPYFQVELCRGFFWYYLEKLDSAPGIMADGQSPCMRYNVRPRGTFLIRVRAYKYRISVEFCHILTDGTGASMFLRSLVTEYFRQSGVDIADWGDIPDPDDDPQAGEFRDANQILGIEEFPKPVKRNPAFHVQGQILPRHCYAVITGLLSAAAVKDRARFFGTSITAYLTAVVFYVYQEYIYDQPDSRMRRWKRKPLRVLVPVNLRPFFPSRTRRNFFVFIDPEIDLRLGRYDFPEIIHRVHSYMQLEVNKKNLSRHLSRNVGSERSWYVRIIPLRIKDQILKLVYRLAGDRTNTTSLSNLGRLSFPEEISGRISWLEFIPPPAPVYGLSLGVVSHADSLAVSFGSLLEEAEIERRFFRFLRKDGLHVKIVSNRDKTGIGR